MDHNGSTLDFSTSAPQDSMTFQGDVPVQHSLSMWADPSQSFTLQDHMEWLANHGVQSLMPNQQYFLSLQQSLSDASGAVTESQGSIMQYPTASELNTSTTNCPSLVFSSAESPARSTQAFDNATSIDNNNCEVRPKSADTMLESGGSSSTESRPSSNSSSPMSRGPKFKVPTIKTQFGPRDEAVCLTSAAHNDGIQVAPDTDSMTAMSNEWMQVHDNSDQASFYGQSLSAVSSKPSPALLEPFQWQSPATTRRTSVSSAVSGPVFSPYGTPTSAMWQQSMLNSPFAQQLGTPRSLMNRYNGSPQSPHQPRNHATWSRAQYLNALRQTRTPIKSSAMTTPTRVRGAPRSAIDSYTFARNTLPSQHRSRTAEHRTRARGDNPDAMSITTPQLALPPFQVGTLYSSPDVSQSEFRASSEIQTPPRNILPSSTQSPMGPPSGTSRVNITPNFNSLHMNTPYSCQQPFQHVPSTLQSSIPSSSPIPTPAHQPPLPVPSEPPLSDFLVNPTSSSGSSSSPTHNHPPACGPIRQSPHFEGDIYTPRYKRRNAAGKWEGWCGYCQPGRWLDLKNSRYWEDKLRNHGICARTKTFFDGPLRVRWVSDRGTIWEGEAGDSGFDLAGKEGIEDDGVGRKREGLCGECNTWVGMDGMRSRGKGRCVAWWMHAYKCHEQSKSRQDGPGTLQ